MLAKPLILLLCLICISSTVFADLKPIYLKLNLSGPEHAVTKDEVLQLTLTFKNTSKKNHAILIPGLLNQGKRLIHFSYYTVKNNHYTEVAREKMILEMDTIPKGNIGVKSLGLGDSVTVPVFFNDKQNHRKHIEAHHQIPDLPPGEYKILAWYIPWEQDYSSYLFNKIPAFFHSDEQLDTNKLNVPEAGLNSNYYTLTIAAEPEKTIPFQYTRFCSKNCELCQAIEIEDWEKVKRIIHKQTFYSKASEIPKTDTSWQQNHKNIAWLYHPPDAILLSLPTYSDRRVIFKNSNGYHYFHMVWQHGTIYPAKSRLQSLMYLFLNNPPLKTSEVDYCKLIKFEPY